MSNPPQSIIISTLGPLVLGLMFQQILLGIIIIQASQYYARFSARDPMFYLALVGAMLILNVLEAAMDFHVIYRTVILHYGDFFFFDLQTWTMWAEPAITAFVGFLAQLFFVERCVKVTKGSWYVIILLASMLLLSLGSGVAVSVSFFKVKLFSKLAVIPIPICFWLISTAATDILIMSILCAALHFSKTLFTRTENVISKLIRLSMETSAITALVALVNLILYFAEPGTAYQQLSSANSLLPQFSICRVYTITVLVTLLARDNLRRELEGQSFYNCSSFGFGRAHCDQGITNKAVEVKMTTIVEHNGRRERSVGGPESEPESDEPRRSQADAKPDNKSIWVSAV
ncbi:hypothetical protein B0H15DRAFT_956499 [Mycena belliarum]|uniref:DUF6534 domain-containing protein n=1 Tax=Mycena belliarum TaxID=1033014 RepID=A0AAD6XME8_9AGAR|nr:hypothetical protein B0H15DRAFT_956499 [Mycena belliae]